jgi:hypothetical protein
MTQREKEGDIHGPLEIAELGKAPLASVQRCHWVGCRKVAERLVDHQEKKSALDYGESTHRCRSVLRVLFPAPFSEDSIPTLGHLPRKPTKHPYFSSPGSASGMAPVAEAGRRAETSSTGDEHAGSREALQTHSRHGSCENDARICCAILCMAGVGPPLCDM